MILQARLCVSMTYVFWCKRKQYKMYLMEKHEFVGNLPPQDVRSVWKLWYGSLQRNFYRRQVAKCIHPCPRNKPNFNVRSYICILLLHTTMIIYPTILNKHVSEVLASSVYLWNSQEWWCRKHVIPVCQCSIIVFVKFFVISWSVETLAWSTLSISYG